MTASTGLPLRPSAADYVIGALAGGVTVLAVSALVMMALATGPSEAITVARQTGSRVIGFAMMCIGCIAGIALTPSVLKARAARRQSRPVGPARAGHYPLAVLAGIVVALAALGVSLSLASKVENLVRLLLVLVAPSSERFSAWLSVTLVLGGVLMVTIKLIQHLDREIHRSRVANRDAESAMVQPEDVTQEVARRSPAELLDTGIRVTLGAMIAAGFALRVLFVALQAFGAASVTAFFGLRGTGTQLLIALVATVATAIGARLGLKLDEYWKARSARRRRVVPLGAWHGYTPVAWIGGILAAKVLSGVAFGLASIVFLPIDAAIPGTSMRSPLTAVYFLVGVIWMLIIGRAVARGIDALIVRQRSLRLPPREPDPAS